jgi:predicted dehydrogenase/threonine dehydrogenase-like Zn-dependent dehydrogenase
MKIIAQNYKSGELSLLSAPVPACRPGGVLVRSAFSLISAGTELTKISESKMSLIAKARARPDQVAKVLQSVRQHGFVATYSKVINRLESYTPLGYSLAGTVAEVGEGAEEFRIGQSVACAGNKFALHAEYNWVPRNLCAAVPPGVSLEHASFAAVGAIGLHGLRQSDIHLDESACVIGLGLLGQIAVRLLKSAGAVVVGLDPIQVRCQLAENGGATKTLSVNDLKLEALKATVSEITDGLGFDVVFITAGGRDNRPVRIAAELARDRARIVDIGKCRLDLPWNAYYEKELDVRFSRSYGPGRYDSVYEEDGVDYPVGYVRWTERRNLQSILKFLADGRLDVAPLISGTFPFENAVEVYERMRRGDNPGPAVLFQYSNSGSVQHRVSTKAAVPTLGKIRIGVIGAGNYASSMLLPHVAAHPHTYLAEVVTTSALSGADASRRFGFERQSTSVEDMLSSDDIDAVLIATRHSTHATLVCAALRAGKAVFVEKPLAIDRVELAEIARAIQETGNDRLMVGFNRRFSPLLNEMKKLWGAKTGRHVANYRVNAGGLEKGSWYADTREGTRFVGEGGHFIDTLSWWLDAAPIQVSGAATADGLENLNATVTFADGSLAMIAYITNGDHRFPKERLEIFGQGRVASFDNFARFEVWSGGRQTIRRARTLDKGQRAQIKAFLASVKNGCAMPISAQALIATTCATLAVEESIRANRPLIIMPGEVDSCAAS